MVSSAFRGILGAAVVAATCVGCDTARPGAGFTNGPSPDVLKAEDKPAVRDDLHEPDVTAERHVLTPAPGTAGPGASTEGLGNRPPGSVESPARKEGQGSPSQNAKPAPNERGARP